MAEILNNHLGCMKTKKDTVRFQLPFPQLVYLPDFNHQWVCTCPIGRFPRPLTTVALWYPIIDEIQTENFHQRLVELGAAVTQQSH